MMIKLSPLAAACLAAALAVPAAYADAPQYTITDLGVVAGGTASQGFGISPDGSIAVGRSLGSPAPAYTWTAGTGMVALPNLSGRNFAQANDVNASGVVVGTSTTTSFGSGALPVLWQNGAIVALPMGSETVGRAEAVNASGLVAGSVGGGISQRGALFTTGGMSVITATTANGTFMNTAFGINDAGLVVGTGIDPTNAALTVGLLYNTVTGVMTNLGALPGQNSAIPFDISESGYVVGNSSINGGSGSVPFIWSAAGGMVAVPLPAGTSQGSLRGVNDSGWAVGIASSAFAVPFLYDGTNSYTIESLLPAGSGWTFNNTSNAAYAITNSGVIVGTSVINGLTHAFVMTPVPEPGTWALMLAGLAVTGAASLRRRRNH